ncbi:MAG TPA: hypothetical protein VGP08_13785 [Pyrinomonadaceae bacterium]|jgi:hypothetical protein|nr:hypothetical protein [Pyrinomonadaceae bacterium]
MTRYSDTPEEPSGSADGPIAEFDGNGRDPVAEQLSGRIVDGDARRIAREHPVEFSHDPNAVAEPAVANVMFLPHQLIIMRVDERLAAAEGVQALALVESPAVAVARERPEVEGMLKKVVAAGGRQIIDRMKEYDAKIAAVECAGPENLGRLFKAYYVPVLLSALSLDDEEFDTEYPGESILTSEERGELLDAILGHAEDCRRCGLKYSSDMEWDSYVEKARKSQCRVRIKA